MNASGYQAGFVLAAGLIGAAAVAVAASASHGSGYDPSQRELIELATHYALLHAAALLGVAFLVQSGEAGRRATIAAGILFIIGCVLFGGGMVLWAITHIAIFDVAIPFGGTSFILGWLAIALSGLLRWRKTGR